MSGYRDTFRKHRILFCLPPLLIAVAVGVLAFGASKKYDSYASLWIDNGPLVGSSLDSTTGSQPSGGEQTLLNELLSTKNFPLDVGNGSSLKAYIKSQGGTSQQQASNLATAVRADTSSTAPGPQVLEVSFTGPTPDIAESTLQSLITHLQGSMTQYGQAFGQSAQAYYQAQVNSATAALTKATAAATAYARSHPGATGANSQSYATLLAAETSATGQLASATTQLNQASVQASGAGTSTLVRVIDPPSAPSTPTSGKKKAAEMIGGGLVGGILISFLIIVAMTPTIEDRWDDELEAYDPAGLTPPQPAPAQASSGYQLAGRRLMPTAPALAAESASSGGLRRQFAGRLPMIAARGTMAGAPDTASEVSDTAPGTVSEEPTAAMSRGIAS